MKRSNEAFKDEVFRRYNVAKRNRRNLRIYAATSLVLGVLVVGVIGPLALGTSIPEAVASWIDNRSPKNEPNPLEEYLNEPVATMRVINPAHSTMLDCTDAQANELVDLLVHLPLTELSSPPEESSEVYRLRILQISRDVLLSLDSDGILTLNCIRPGIDEPETKWYQVSQKELPAFLSHLEMLVGFYGQPEFTKPVSAITDNPL